MRPTSAMRRVYIRLPHETNMAEKPDPTPMPDLRMTSDTRIPTNVGIGGVLKECTQCSNRLCESINLPGSDGGNEYICIPCVATFYHDDDIPYDDWGTYDIPYSALTIAKYNLQPMGVNQTLDCGCILTDMTAWMKPNNTWSYITLCSDHKIFCEPKILMSDIDYYSHSCHGCDCMFPENQMTIITPGADKKTRCLCMDCYHIHTLARNIRNYKFNYGVE
jgi:hypothetical protein